MFKDQVNFINEKIDNFTFSELIRFARDTIGLRQYKVAAYLGMTVGRLSRLETAFYREMPNEQEVKRIAEFYKMPFEKLYKKARDQQLGC